MCSMKHDKFLFIIILVGAALALPNLGDRVITGDEAYTVLQGKTVVEHGYPYAFYKNIEILPKATYYFFGAPLFNWTPWLESYITAAALLVAGLDGFWLRLPFVLFGIATVVLFYLFVQKMTKDRFIVVVSTLLLLTSVTFLLHVRQARWYSLSAFFALATWFAYWSLLREGKSWLWLAGAAALLFHSMLFTFFAVMFSIGVHYISFEILFERNKLQPRLQQLRMGLRAWWRPLLVVTLLTLPWFIITGQLAAKSGGFTLSPVKLIMNSALYGYYAVVLLLPTLIFVPLIILFLRKLFVGKDSSWIRMPREGKFILTVVLASLAFLSVKADLLPAVRYLVFLIPLFSLMTAYALAWFKEQNKIIAGLLVTIIILGNYAFVAPFLPFRDVLSNVSGGKESAGDFIRDSLQPRAYLIEYVYELVNDVTTTDDEIVRVMRERGRSEDTFVASHFTHALIVYTEMNVGLPDLRAEAYYGRFGGLVNVTPQWIIPRGFELEQKEIEEFLNEADERYNLSRYERITLGVDDSERWASAPDPINHRFRTKEGELAIYYKPR